MIQHHNQGNSFIVCHVKMTIVLQVIFGLPASACAAPADVKFA